MDPSPEICTDPSPEICTETPHLKSLKNLSKMLSMTNQTTDYDSLRRNAVLKEIKNKKAAGFNKIIPEIWKTTKFDNLILQLCNAMYKENTIEKWTKSCILPFPIKGNLRMNKNNRGISLTAHNAQLLNSIRPEIEKVRRKKSEGLSMKSLHNHSDSDNPSNNRAWISMQHYCSWIISRYSILDTEGKWSKCIWPPEETISAINNASQKHKMVHSQDGDTDLCDSVVGIL